MIEYTMAPAIMSIKQRTKLTLSDIYLYLNIDIDTHIADIKL